MRVRVKLLGTFRGKTPPTGALELADEATIAEALRALEISAPQVQAVAVNGRIERDYGRRLCGGDELTVLPPVSGGLACGYAMDSSSA